jgi:hypothetical protein
MKADIALSKRCLQIAGRKPPPAILPAAVGEI